MISKKVWRCLNVKYQFQTHSFLEIQSRLLFSDRIKKNE